MLLTYQTKIKHQETHYLDKMAVFSGMIERKLFVDSFIKGKTRAECKTAYTKKYGITARQFNAIYIQLNGKMQSIIELHKVHLTELRDKIKSLEKFIAQQIEKAVRLHAKITRLEKKFPFSVNFKKTVKQYRNIKFLLHQKKRKLALCKKNLERFGYDAQNNRLRICFGSKKLFQKQFNLEENGYQSHEAWKRDWLKARSAQFFCIGSKDETAGNQTCTYSSSRNELRLRVADNFLKEYGHYIIYKDISFPYGQEVIDHALKTYRGTTSGGKPANYVNSAISYRFTKNERGWYINAAVELDTPDITTTILVGSLGVDLNVGFMSLCEVDRFGNPLYEETIPLRMYNRSSDQITAALGDGVKAIVDKAMKTQKPMVIEVLDFSKKKSMLGEESKKYSRMLSGFAYSKFKEMLKSRATKYGVEVIEVTAAYTSVIGQMNFMKRYGLSSHGSAACVIARRGLGLTIEKPKYDSILGNYTDTMNHRPLKSRWSSISYRIKKNYRYFNERIELLKLEA